MAAPSAVAVVAVGLGIGGGVASAASGSVTWDDGSERITRTISEVNPAAGDTITVKNVFDRTGGVVEYIQAVKDVHPTCLTYVAGSAKVDGSAQNLESQGPDFARVTGSWALYPSISPNLRTYEFSYKVGADCARGVALSSSLYYSGTLGSGNYPDKGPAITVRKNVSVTTLAAVSGAQVGQATTLSATVTGGANGDVVEFYDGATKLGTGALNNGVATYSWTPVAGAHSLVAKYLATGVADASQSAAQNVTVSVPDVATQTSVTVPATATTGVAVDLKATVTPAPSGGTVQFKDGAANLGGPVNVVNGVATLPQTFATAGAKSITAVFSGVAGFSGSTSAAANIAVSVPDVATQTSVTVPATASTGQSVDLTATVTPAPSGGSVQFKDGDTNIGAPVDAAGGSVTLPFTFATAGAKSITAVFSGVAGFSGSTSAAANIAVSVPDVATQTSVTAPATASTGQAVDLTATVTPAPSGGSVQFKDGGTNIGGPVNLTNGVATLSQTFATAGAKSITAVFSGVAGFQGSTSAPANIAVSVPDVATQTSVTVPATASTGQAVDLTATVTPAPTSGTVQFKDGAANLGGPVTLVNGEATLSHAFDAAGAKSITAVFSGAAGFSGSTSAAANIAVSVPDVATQTSVTVPATASTGQSVDLTATVTPAPSGGSVQFKDGGTNIGGPVNLTNGVATLSQTFATAGAKSITAVFSGAAGFQGSTSAAANIAVSVPDVATQTSVTVPATASTGQAVDLKATVTPAPTSGTVQFKDGGTNLGGPVNLVNGEATLSHAFDAAGAKNITAVFSGAAGFTGSTSAAANIAVSVPDVATQTSVTVPATASTGQSVDLKAVITPAPSGGTVQFKDGDTNIGAPVDAAGGSVTLPFTFATAGAKSITAVFSGVAGFSGSTSAPANIAVSVPDVATQTSVTVPATASTGQAVDLKATVSPAPTSGTVQFKDGGTNLGGPVNVVNGEATLSHAFDAAGAKSITAVFSGAAGFSGSTSAAANIAVSVPDVATQTSVTAPATASTGQAVDLTATVTPAPTSGTVQFKDGAANLGGPVTLVNGVATLSQTFASAG
ncbi:beta strand repeat-containing protein, partial [Rhodococcus sp. NPDC059234]|uniref:beta strand repeat-containing protein n=1 Tax=Rhodococcus sp. NPDC059234 TaxID=3346781 RepID=UPI00366B7357